ncbi:MAG: DNA polymerase III subunit delta' [Alphaproteobacteria bacterium]|nr:DNA polymerase III subunit delta' [Alphaproteobacteria bacterium]
MSDAAAPDQEPHTAHPRDAFEYVGHDEAESALAEGLAGSRLHHAWLITGPKGIGKATLAYRAARRALGAKIAGPRPLAVAPDDPVARRIAQRAHPDLFVLARGVNDRGKPKRDITADDARALSGFFALQPAEGGMRVAIVDAVDDLNRHAANAILKTLEEPPANTVLFLVCHAPGAALATIRSRCRQLKLRPLDDDTVREAVRRVCGAEPEPTVLRLAAGRPGRAIALVAQDSAGLAARVLEALSALEKNGARAFLPIVFAGGADKAERLTLALDVAGDWIRQAVAASQGVPVAPLYAGELPAMQRLVTPDNAARWAQAWSDLEQLRAEADSLDLDPGHALARAAAILDRAAAARA